ncbi:TetR/AcrR family transcriptional regulator [Mycolicibacter hiberniae]|uniref:TetR/AcrR family transcriptional regulator n=1 Tax=Mycolicibacter hiberniae TaxID=29314 RepID=UPI000A1592B3|nr:TetR/AcrR family transcriptional regulator [Mycolicibacter hiberniae]MCV7085041.1 TetR/AcrR family transcriptional regulator [Mycolicibacter hiberniae]ORV68675.1 TetR family transcriptional regulator [Mycolicibacter hiberniae]
MAERWTRQRRVEHTRSVLLDAAEEVFARRGYAGAALEDIADAAGYTRGAIYSHFGAKEELFLAVIERHLQRFLSSFEDVISSFETLEELDVAQFAQRWRELVTGGPDSAALGHEFSLFLLRNPEARERLAGKRRQALNSLADYIEKHSSRLGGELTVPAHQLAKVLVATNEGITIGSYLDGEDLQTPFLQMVLASVRPKPAAGNRPGSQRGS